DASFHVRLPRPMERVPARRLEEPFAPASEPFSRAYHRTQHADVAAEPGWHQADRVRGDAEGTGVDRAAHRLERVRRLVLRDRPADDDERRIQAVHKGDREVS